MIVLRNLLAVATAVVVSVPAIWMLSTALKGPDEIFAQPLSLIPRPPRWENFGEVWAVAPLARYLVNSFFIASAITGLEVTFGILAAYAFVRLPLPGGRALFALFVATLFLPGQVIVIPNFVLMRLIGWVDSYPGLIVPPACTAFATYYLGQQFRIFPREIELAARVDGCDPLRALGLVVLPALRPALVAIVVLAFVAQWNAFFWPLVMTSSESLRTITLGLRYLADSVGPRYHLVMAGSTLATLPPLFIFLLAQRHVRINVLGVGLR